MADIMAAASLCSNWSIWEIRVLYLVQWEYRPTVLTQVQEES